MNSILSYPERGIGGNASYRGNCSPKLVEDLINFYKWQSISDYMCGSGTTEDVARRLGIESNCYDLNRGFNLLLDDIPERNEAIFFHPPYWNMIDYAGNQYSKKEIITQYGFDPCKYDISKITQWNDFIRVLNYCTIKQFNSLEKGGRMAILVGDLKRKGKLYSMILDMAKPDVIENVLIKMQHNCMSDTNKYNGKFIKIVHEYVLILRKDFPTIFDVSVVNRHRYRIYDSQSITWKDLIANILDENGGMLLQELYKKVQLSKKARAKYFREKVRQTLYINTKIFYKKENLWYVY